MNYKTTTANMKRLFMKKNKRILRQFLRTPLGGVFLSFVLGGIIFAVFWIFILTLIITNL